MTQQITVTLPVDVKQALNSLSQSEGISANAIIERAIKHHLFLHQFRTLKERMSGKAQEQGISTDQDIFDRIS